MSGRHECALSREGRASVALDGVLHSIDAATTVRSHRAGNRLYLQLDESDWTFEDRRLVARQVLGAGGSDGRVLSPMNGRVTQMPVRVGAQVTRGETLIVLEAMKMEHALTARASGTVTAVHVAMNDQVAPGKLLVDVAQEKGETVARDSGQVGAA